MTIQILRPGKKDIFNMVGVRETQYMGCNVGWFHWSIFLVFLIESASERGCVRASVRPFTLSNMNICATS